MNLGTLPSLPEKCISCQWYLKMTLACRVWNEGSIAQERVTFQISCFHVSVSSFLPR